MRAAAWAAALMTIAGSIGCGKSPPGSAAEDAAKTQAAAAQPALPRTGFRGLDEYRASRVAVLIDDFGELGRYREANAKLPAPGPQENRVVFFGDSATELWKLESYFPGQPYLNRGIDGQTTAQMLVRFRQDVIDLHPRVVVILAGSNDIAGITGPARNEDIEANYASFAQLARANRIQVVLSSILPVNNYAPFSQDFFAQRPGKRIVELNDWLRSYCAGNGVVYLDYFSAMVDERGMMKRELAEADGLHPSAAGYGVMAPLAQAAIARALSAKP